MRVGQGCPFFHILSQGASMFHLLAYGLATGGAVTLSDMAAATDGEFSQRNNHIIFSEDYNLLAQYSSGATITRMQTNVPHINYLNPHVFYPLNLSLTVPTNPAVPDYRAYPIKLPQNEEIAIQVSDSASEQANSFLWIAPPSWNMQLPRGEQRLTIVATASVVTVANAWSGFSNITLASTLRGGVYAVNGIACIAAATLAFRINFPRRKMYNGRKLIPGDLATQTFGLIPNKFGMSWLGEWGRFNTFELPTIQAYANASATVTHTLFIDVSYLGDSPALFDAVN